MLITLYLSKINRFSMKFNRSNREQYRTNNTVRIVNANPFVKKCQAIDII